MAYTDEQLEEIILRHFHGFTKEQWAELKNSFPYCEILPILRDAAQPIEDKEERITHFHVADNSDAFRDWLKQKDVKFTSNGHFTSIPLSNNIPYLGNNIFKLGYDFALYKAALHQPEDKEDAIAMRDINNLLEEVNELQDGLENKDGWIWTDELIKEMIWSKLPLPDHYVANVQKCLDEFKASHK